MTWFTEGEKTAATAGQVLADTGAINGPSGLDFKVLVSAAVASSFNVQMRDGDNTSTVQSFRIDILGSSPALIPWHVDLDDQQRVRVTAVGAVLGGVQANILI